MNLFRWAILSLSLATTSYGQALVQTGSVSSSTQDTPWTIAGNGANFNTWQKTSYEIGPNGELRPHVHTYVELASGLNYLNNGAWTPSVETIEPYSSGAIAQQGQYQVIFANNLNTVGAIDMQTPDGKRLRSNIIGLGYYDRSTGNSVLIAQLQDSTGEIISANQVLYPNAFEGVTADVRYTYKRSGLEQDVILRQQPPTPESLGLNSDTTELEVMTAFINPPTATVGMADAGTADLEPDENIGWGATHLGTGHAFDLGAQSNLGHQLKVSKQYVTIQGQQILLEKVSVKELWPKLSNLPPQASNQSKLPALVSRTLMLPQLPVAKATTKPITLASAARPNRGYVLDYVTISSAEANFTFLGDTTYYVSSEYDLTGATVIEGNSVIKLGGASMLEIDPNGSVICDTSPYRPAVFTSTNDNTVGQSFGSGSPAVDDAFIALYINATNTILHDLRFAYCAAGVAENPEFSMLDIWNCQFVHANIAAIGYNVGLHNVLISCDVNWDSSVDVEGTNLVAENVTADNGYDFIEPDNAEVEMGLTNCLVTRQPLIAPGFPQVPATNSVICLMSPSSPVFQSAGGGNYYLTNGSTYRGYGTTNVSAELLAELQKKTTYPPVIFSNIVFSATTNFSIHAWRDTNANLDIGYHYDPIDYAFGGCEAESNMTFTAGTAVGWFRTTSGWDHAGYGIYIANQQIASFQGTVTSPCYWARLNTVQEDDTTAGYGPGGLDGEDNQNNEDIALSPIVQANFCRFSMMAGESGSHARDDYGYLVVDANNSEFYSDSIGGYGLSFNYTNCLFDRCSIQNVQGWVGDFINIEDCTFHGTSLVLTPNSTAFPINVKNCSFDGTSISVSGYGDNASYDTYNYNAYTNASGMLPFGANNVIVTNGFNWQSSWFGNFYLPSNSPVIARGSTNANYLGLYHFTTQTNQAIEGDSIVDIGYHYVATDASGNPLDSNGDGVPDYIEDTNETGILGPFISITTPANDAVFGEPATITIQTFVTDWSGTVTNVQFLQNGTNMASVPTTPFQFSWPIVPYGYYSLSAVATDWNGLSSTSAPIVVAVTNLCGSF